MLSHQPHPDLVDCQQMTAQHDRNVADNSKHFYSINELKANRIHFYIFYHFSPDSLSMTTVEPYRPPQLEFHSDATSNGRRLHSSSNSIVKDIPPAVPSPHDFQREHLRRANPYHHQTPPLHSECLSRSRINGYSLRKRLPAHPRLSTPFPCRRTLPQSEGRQLHHKRCYPAQAPAAYTIAVASVFFHRFFMRISMMSEKPQRKTFSASTTT